MANFFATLKKSGKVKFQEKSVLTPTKKVLTLDDVKARIVETLANNKAVFKGTFKGDAKPNPNYKKLGNGTYQFSIKYGIRSLEGVLEGETYVVGLTADQMPDAFDASIQLVESGACDKAIQKAMAANAAMRVGVAAAKDKAKA